MRRLLRPLLLALVAAACTSPPPPAVDASADDAATVTPRDVGRDASPPPGPRYCSLCHSDADCGGGLCLSLGTSGREYACGITCTSDVDCERAGADATCVEIDPGLPHQCRPRTGSCIESRPASPCSDAMPCTGTYAACLVFDARPPVCTARCRTDGDCPLGMRHCEARGADLFCAPDADFRASTCATTTSDGPAPVCACGRESPTSISGQLLTSLGLDACDLAFRDGAIEGFGPELAHDRFRLTFTDRIMSYAPEVPRFGHALATTLDASGSPTPVANALSEAARLDDLEPVAAHVPMDATDLAVELAGLVTEAGGVPNAGALADAANGLAPNVRATLAPIVRATRDALAARTRAIAGLDDGTLRQCFELPTSMFLPLGLGSRVTDASTQGLLLGDVRMREMAQAAIDLAATIETYSIASLAGTPAHLYVSTPAGAIVLSGSSDDMHADAEILLMVDFGGNDTYRGSTGATASITNGISVVIDAAGVDDYGYVAVPVPSDTNGPADARRLPSDGRGRVAIGANNGPLSLSSTARQGAGRLGIGMLFDQGPEGDHYRSLRMSQGYGALGVGVLYDEAGDDVYEGEAAVQGAAAFGLGVLYDEAGDDHYTAYAFSQGFGYIRGIGTLYDARGTDDYFAHPTDVLYFSPQNPGGSNSSFCQGAGFGRRDDSPMGVPMSGGLGVLRDALGNDTYTVGIFGQGTGYWFGTGLLLEGDGGDQYDGAWYVHGSAAHFAVAALLDDGGTDTYQATMNTSVGVGHDFSIGWLVDRTGDDIYRAPNLSLGSGNAAGFGFFVDLAGMDTYTAASDFSFGNASIETPGDMLRSTAGTIGLFVERGGMDGYTRPTLAPVAQDAMWTQERHAGMGEHAGGIDTASGTVGLGLD